MPLVGGGGALGEVTVKAVGASVLLHDDFTAADVDADYSVPGQYVLGRPFTARVHFFRCRRILCSPPTWGETLEVTGLPEVLQASTYVPPKVAGAAPELPWVGRGGGRGPAGAGAGAAAAAPRQRTSPLSTANKAHYRGGLEHHHRQPLPAEDLTPRAKGKPSQGYGQGAGQRPASKTTGAALRPCPV